MPPPHAPQDLSVVSELELHGGACHHQPSGAFSTPGRQVTVRAGTVHTRRALLRADHCPKHLEYSLQPHSPCTGRRSFCPRLPMRKLRHGAPGRPVADPLLCACRGTVTAQCGGCCGSCLERVLPEAPHPSWRHEPLIGQSDCEWLKAPQMHPFPKAEGQLLPHCLCRAVCAPAEGAHVSRAVKHGPAWCPRPLRAGGV